MSAKIISIVCLLFCVSCATLQTPPHARLIQYYQVKTLKPYDEVLSELEIAITEHNFRITGHSRVGKVIRDRGTKNFPEYDTLQFCNLTHAKKLLEMSPHAISYMPCNIVTYQYNGQTIIKTQLLPVDSDNQSLNQFADKMNQTLKKIVNFAAEE